MQQETLPSASKTVGAVRWMDSLTIYHSVVETENVTDVSIFTGTKLLTFVFHLRSGVIRSWGYSTTLDASSGCFP